MLSLFDGNVSSWVEIIFLLMISWTTTFIGRGSKQGETSQTFLRQKAIAAHSERGC
jgi:hypothetical protein